MTMIIIKIIIIITIIITIIIIIFANVTTTYLFHRLTNLTSSKPLTIVRNLNT